MPAAHRVLLAPLTAIVLSGSAATGALAAWPHDPSTGNVALCKAANNQYLPQGISDGAGGGIVAWEDTRAGNSDIYVQRVNAAGQAVWTTDGVALCSFTGNQITPTLVPDGSGGAIVAWADGRNGNNDIYAQRVNASGVTQWTLNGVGVCTQTGDQAGPYAASDGAGGAFLFWTDNRGGAGSDVYGQRLNSAGAPQWLANGLSFCAAASNQYVSATVPDDVGGAFVVWVDTRLGPGDIYAQRVNAVGTPLWASNGAAVCTSAGDQASPQMVADGVGGVIIPWRDMRGGGFDIYAQRMSGAGNTMWSGGGIPVCTATGEQYSPVIASDGSAGAIVAWSDQRPGVSFDVYAQRINSSGTVVWTGDGVPICTAPDHQFHQSIVADGVGGAIVTWEDHRTGSGWDVYAERLNAGGDPLWAPGGVVLSTAISHQEYPVIFSDGASGAIVAWQDLRNLNHYDIQAQRIERFGMLGNPEPVSAGVRDVPNDQGGKVKVSWYASYLDADPTYGISDYSIWRSAPPNAAMTALRAGARLIGPKDAVIAAPGERIFTTSIDGTQTIFWELVATQIADGDAGYSIVTTTTSDSVAAGNPRTLFRVQAHDANRDPFWNSAPDSGYSVDNLAPAAPSPFTGQYAGGTTTLHWGRNSEADFASYTLHRGTSPSFVPGPGNLVTSQPDTGYVDNAGQTYFYKLAAMDLHGNLSSFVLLQPAGTTEVVLGPLPAQIELGPASPNPALRGATFRFALPRAGEVRLALFDQQGRRVRELEGGLQAAGEHVSRWDGRDNTGQMAPSGIYFCRLDAAGRTLTRRLAVVH